MLQFYLCNEISCQLSCSYSGQSTGITMVLIVQSFLLTSTSSPLSLTFLMILNPIPIQFFFISYPQKELVNNLFTLEILGLLQLHAPMLRLLVVPYTLIHFMSLFYFQWLILQFHGFSNIPRFFDLSIGIFLQVFSARI